MRFRKLSIGLAAAALGALALGALPAIGADHKDAPLARAAARSDINDVYIFRGQAAAGVVYVMTINPLTSPTETPTLRLDPDTLYELKVDTDGNGIADVSYKISASGSGAAQDITVKRATGSAAHSNGNDGDVILQGKSSTGAAVTTISDSTGRKLYVGSRDDPFFFDLVAFQNGLAFTNPGVDTFKGTNITAIVLEVPTVPSQTLGVWGTTTKNGVQVDRMGRPAVATVFIPASQKDAFNANTPDRDEAIYEDELRAALTSLGSPNTETLVGALLPDILTVNLAMPVGYLNGRGLPDDVIDGSLKLITGNNAASDGVPANDKAFLSAFPYLAEPHGAAAPAPAPPSTGSGFMSEDDLSWTLPIGLIVAAILLVAAGVGATRPAASK